MPSVTYCYWVLSYRNFFSFRAIPKEVGLHRWKLTVGVGHKSCKVKGTLTKVPWVLLKPQVQSKGSESSFCCCGRLETTGNWIWSIAVLVSDETASFSFASSIEVDFHNGRRMKNEPDERVLLPPRNEDPLHEDAINANCHKDPLQTSCSPRELQVRMGSTIILETYLINSCQKLSRSRI